VLNRCRDAHRGLDVAKDLAELLSLARGEQCIKRCSDDITALLGLVSHVPRERRPVIVARTRKPVIGHLMRRVKASSISFMKLKSTKTSKKVTIRESFRRV